MACIETNFLFLNFTHPVSFLQLISSKVCAFCDKHAKCRNGPCKEVPCTKKWRNKVKILSIQQCHVKCKHLPLGLSIPKLKGIPYIHAGKREQV